MCGKSPNCKHHNFGLAGKKLLSIVLRALTMNSLSSETCPWPLNEELYHLPKLFTGFSYNRRHHLTLNMKPLFHQFPIILFNLANSRWIHGAVVFSIVMSSILARMGGNQVLWRSLWPPTTHYKAHCHAITIHVIVIHCTYWEEICN